MEWYSWLILVVLLVLILRGIYSLWAHADDGGSNDDDNDD